MQRPLESSAEPLRIPLPPERGNDRQGASRASAAKRLDKLLARNRGAEFLNALRDLSKAEGGIAAIATRAGLSRPGLYRSLSPAGNPELGTITAVLNVMGLRFGVSVTGHTSAVPKRQVATRGKMAIE